jgi:hypothetical protein
LCQVQQSRYEAADLGYKWVRSREENFDCVTGQPEVRRPGSRRCSRGEQFGNAAETLRMRRPKRPLAGGAFRNHQRRYIKSELDDVQNRTLPP